MVSSATSSLYIDIPIKSSQMTFKDLTLLSIGMSQKRLSIGRGYLNFQKLVRLNPGIFPFLTPSFENYQKMIARLEQNGLIRQNILNEGYFVRLTEYGEGKFDILSIQLFS